MTEHHDTELDRQLAALDRKFREHFPADDREMARVAGMIDEYDRITEEYGAPPFGEFVTDVRMMSDGEPRGDEDLWIRMLEVSAAFNRLRQELIETVGEDVYEEELRESFFTALYGANGLAWLAVE